MAGETATKSVRLTEPQSKFLSRLREHRGVMLGAQLSRPDRQMASKCQMFGWARWERPERKLRQPNLDAWTIHLTEAGRAALEREGGA